MTCSTRVARLLALLLLLSSLISLNLSAAENWIELRSAHFTVYTPASEKEARTIANQFEQIRDLFHSGFPTLQTDPYQPIVIIAVKGEKGMKELLPEEWEVKGHLHAAGLYQEGFDKHYVILQLDAEGQNPYHVLYHEYTHSLLHLNFSHLPPWFDEGMAEYLGNAILGDKESSMGVINSSHLYVLHTNQLLPIETLLTAGHDSPYYNESNRATVFYAESWALVHYLMLDPEARQKQLLAHFLEAWDKTHDQVEAARQAFGDLKKFQDTLYYYAHQENFYHMEFKNKNLGADKQATSRPVSPAEVLALRGDFFVHHNRMDAGRPLLDDAVKLDPNLALPHAALANVYFRTQNPLGMVQESTDAIRLGDPSFFPYYLLAVGQWRSGIYNEVTRQSVIGQLQKCIQINPVFAPADDLLSQTYAASPTTQKEAIHFELLAVRNRPGEIQYAYRLAQLLLNNNRDTEAKTVADGIAIDAYTPPEKMMAQQLLARIADHKNQPPTARATPSPAPATAGSFELRSVGVPDTSSSEAGDRPAHVQKLLLSVDGTISAVDCSHRPEITLTLDGAKSYHVTDVGKIAITAQANSAPPDCSQWPTRKVNLSFVFAPGEQSPGEVARLAFQ
jgi:hypothetical protein